VPYQQPLRARFSSLDGFQCETNWHGSESRFQGWPPLDYDLSLGAAKG